MIFNPLSSQSAEEKMIAYKEFNNPLEHVELNNFVGFDNKAMEADVDNEEEIKRLVRLEKAKKEHDYLTSEYSRLTTMSSKPMSSKPWGASIVGPVTEPKITVPMLPPKQVVDFKKYDNDKVAQNMISKINFTEYDDTDKLYLKLLAARESDFRIDPPNRAYRGMFQFNADSLKAVGINMGDYLASPEVQFQAALKYRDSNIKELKAYQKHIGTKKDGILVTKNGLGAMAHLLGSGTVRDYFDGTKKTKLAQGGFKDGNGTHISEYLKLFAP